MDRLVFGCGYLGNRVAQRWLESRDRVFAVSRSEQSARAMQQDGLLPIVADVTQPESLIDLPEVDTVLYAVGFDRLSGHSIADVYVQGLQNVLAQLPAPRQRLLYISSTGVYGQSAGEWVDESSICQPERAGGLACLAAEQELEKQRAELDSCILRLAGIYGPGRLPRRDALLAGEPIKAPADGWLNLIHVEDAVRVVLAAATAGQLPDRLLVSDGTPLRRQQYFAELCRQLDAPDPCFDEQQQSETDRARASSSKRVSNRQLLDLLGEVIVFDSFADGLADILQAGGDSSDPGAA